MSPVIDPFENIPALAKMLKDSNQSILKNHILLEAPMIQTKVGNFTHYIQNVGQFLLNIIHYFNFSLL